MRAVIFSDIHGNRLALEQMLHDTRDKDIDYYFFCGDIIGYFNETKEVISIMRDIPNLFAVRGNHDDNYLNCLDDSVQRSKYAMMYGVSYLYDYTVNEINFLKSLNIINNLTIDKYSITIIHGSEDNKLDGRIYPDTKLDNCNWLKENMIYFLGHTHYRLHQSYNKGLLINPGSLGQPRDNHGYSYCIYDFDKNSCAFNTVVVDKKYLIRCLQKYETSQEVINYLSQKM